GGRVIRQLVLDPLLPEPLAPEALRRELAQAMRRYDRLGRRAWAAFLARHGAPHVATPAHGERALAGAAGRGERHEPDPRRATHRGGQPRLARPRLAGGDRRAARVPRRARLALRARELGGRPRRDGAGRAVAEPARGRRRALPDRRAAAGLRGADARGV